jgi:hypothetical protein
MRHPRIRRLGIVCAALWWAFPLAAGAPGQDYARQWPLTLGEPEAGAYRVVLDASVYRSASHPGLADIDVFNAQGQAVPAAVLSPAQPEVQSAALLELPWFALPGAGAAAAGSDLRLLAQRAADGSIARVEVEAASVAASPQAGQWLVDASRVREPVRALRLQWQLPAQPLEIGYRVLGSDDLRQWRTLNPGTTLLDLERDGQRLRQGRIVLDGQARYLRLDPLRAGEGPRLVSVSAELVPARPQAQWEWQEINGQRRSADGQEYFEFVSPGRFPVERVDVQLAGNNALEWTLHSREQADASWVWRAGPWMAFQVGDGSRSPPQGLRGPVRDRLWRLTAKSGLPGQAPVLRLGYRPEVMVFLAQGQGPYALAAGSGRAERAAAPIPALLSALRQQHGAQWQPAPAYLAAQPQELAGEAALRPARHVDWKTWLLWALLVAGALLVGLLGLSLLHKRPQGD